MSDIRKALVEVLWEKFWWLDRQDAVVAITDAILAEFEVTPRGFPDSTDVRSVVAARVAFEEAGVRLMAVAGGDATRYLDALGRAVAAGATVGDIAALASPLAAQSVARAWDEYVRARIDAEARTGDRRRVAERVRRQERRRSFEAGFAAALAEKGAPRG